MGGSFSARVPRSSAEVRRVFVHHIVEVEGVGQWEQQGDQRYDEGEEVHGEVEEIRNRTHNKMTHARAMWDECELEPCRLLSQCSVINLKEKQSRDADTNNKEERDNKNKQAQLWFNPQRSRVIGCTREFPHASGHYTCCWACRSVFRVTNSIVVNAPNLVTFCPVREFLVEIHTPKMDL